MESCCWRVWPVFALVACTVGCEAEGTGDESLAPPVDGGAVEADAGPSGSPADAAVEGEANVAGRDAAVDGGLPDAGTDAAPGPVGRDGEPAVGCTRVSPSTIGRGDQLIVSGTNFDGLTGVQLRCPDYPGGPFELFPATRAEGPFRLRIEVDVGVRFDAACMLRLEDPGGTFTCPGTIRLKASRDP